MHVCCTINLLYYQLIPFVCFYFRAFKKMNQQMLSFLIIITNTNYFHMIWAKTYTVVPKSDVPQSDAFLKFSRNFLEILPKFVPKSDAFLGISLNSKCVTFWHDSVIELSIGQNCSRLQIFFSICSSLKYLWF